MGIGGILIPLESYLSAVKTSYKSLKILMWGALALSVAIYHLTQNRFATQVLVWETKNNANSLISILRADTISGGDASDMSITATEILVAIGAPAIPALSSLLDDPTSGTRSLAVSALGRIDDQRAESFLVHQLSDWYTSPSAARYLNERHWQSGSAEERIRYALAQRSRVALLENWQETVDVLSADVQSQRYLTVENALFGYIALGRTEFLEDLVEALNMLGTQTMAEAFLNCGQEKLSDAARIWAQRNNHEIVKGEGNSPVDWGSF